MKHQSPCVVAGVLAAVLIAPGCGVTEPTEMDWNLDKYAGSARPLVLFADNDESPALARQRAELAGHAAGVAERDIVVVEVTADRVRANGRSTDADPAALRQRFSVESGDGFVVVLVGKDTGAKLRKTEPVTADALFRVIDGMPMRQREMRESDPP